MRKAKGRPYWSAQQQKAHNMYDDEEEKGTICGGCNQRRARLRYSNKQWNEYKQRKYQAQSRNKGLNKIERPMCRDCNGEPAMDKKCVGCEKILPLDGFSKNARKSGDKAKCINCTQNWEDLEADPHNAVKEQKIYDNLEESATESTWTRKKFGSTLPSGLGSQSGWDTASNTGTNPRTEHDGVWIREESHNGASHDQLRSDESDSEGTVSTQRAASTINTRASNGTWQGFKPIEQTYRQQRQTSVTTSSNPGFYKQGAYRDDMHTRVKSKWESDKAKQAETKYDADSDDEDDDDDDGSVFEL